MKNPIQMIKQCVEKDEPYFVLRGQDRCALAAIEAYYKPEFGIRLCHKVYGVTRYDTSSLHKCEWLSIVCKK